MPLITCEECRGLLNQKTILSFFRKGVFFEGVYCLRCKRVHGNFNGIMKALFASGGERIFASPELKTIVLKTF